jgi:hypothetical protein
MKEKQRKIRKEKNKETKEININRSKNEGIVSTC